MNHEDTEHPGLSCIHSPYHMIFSRKITDEEWKLFSSKVDSVWNGETWDAEGILAIMREVAPDIQLIHFEEGGKKMPNCDVTGKVDFEKGPVEVRCTEEGEHEQHVCIVMINPNGEEDGN